MTEEIIKGNKLIAEFMGRIVVDNEGYRSTTEANDNGNEIRLGAIYCYHSSWDLLMPVVEKIEQNYTPVEILDYQCRISRSIYNPNEILYSSDESKIEATYKAVIEFIKWYNQNK